MKSPYDGLHDAFTGEALNPAHGLHQCTNCKVYYHADSVEVLRQANAGRCIACSMASVVALTAAQGAWRAGRNHRPNTDRDYRPNAGRDHRPNAAASSVFPFVLSGLLILFFINMVAQSSFGPPISSAPSSSLPAEFSEQRPEAQFNVDSVIALLDTIAPKSPSPPSPQTSQFSEEEPVPQFSPPSNPPPPQIFPAPEELEEANPVSTISPPPPQVFSEPEEIEEANAAPDAVTPPAQANVPNQSPSAGVEDSYTRYLKELAEHNAKISEINRQATERSNEIRRRAQERMTARLRQRPGGPTPEIGRAVVGTVTRYDPGWNCLVLVLPSYNLLRRGQTVIVGRGLRARISNVAGYQACATPASIPPLDVAGSYVFAEY